MKPVPLPSPPPVNKVAFRPAGAEDTRTWAARTPNFSAACAARETTGRVGAVPLYAGESVGAVKAVWPAAETLRELVGGAVALLRRWRGRMSRGARVAHRRRGGRHTLSDPEGLQP
jgi:hypothetical protein